MDASADHRIVFHALIGIARFSRSSRITFIGSKPSLTRLICSRNEKVL
jgi:hypothetical protein